MATSPASLSWASPWATWLRMCRPTASRPARKVVTPGLCGEKAGLQEGDIITKINDTEVASGNDLITAKDNYKPGDTVNLTVYRDGKTITVKLTLEESTPEKTAQQDQAQKEYEEQQQQQLQQEQQQGSGGWPFGGFGY